SARPGHQLEAQLPAAIRHREGEDRARFRRADDDLPRPAQWASPMPEINRTTLSDMWTQHIPATLIAERMDTDPETVRRIARKMGLPPRGNDWAKGRRGNQRRGGVEAGPPKPEPVVRYADAIALAEREGWPISKAMSA